MRAFFALLIAFFVVLFAAPAPAASGEVVHRLDAAHFAQYMRQLLDPEDLTDVPSAFPHEFGAVLLEMSTSATASLGMGADASNAAAIAYATYAKGADGGMAPNAAKPGINAANGSQQNSDRCRKLLNTWLGKCVFAA